MRENLTIIDLQGKPPRHPANPAIFLAFLFFFILGKSMYIGGFGKKARGAWKLEYYFST